MKKFLLITFCYFLISNSLFSQISYESGYFIDTLGKRVDCLIQNNDWKNNPSSFKYKLSKKEKSKIATIKEIKEFGISNLSKYIRHTVLIDKSSDNLSNLSLYSTSEFEEEQQFLKVIIEGETSLYSYENNEILKFFYNKSDEKVEPLIYKIYQRSDLKIGKNYRFRKQLFDALQCESITSKQIVVLEYNEKDLSDIFTKYNTCQNSTFVIFNDKKEIDKFRLALRPGISFASMDFVLDRLDSAPREFNPDPQPNFRFGIEAEFVLPFNKNKWSFLIEPTYQYFTSEQPISPAPTTVELREVDFRSIEVPASLRYYLFLNKNSRFYLNGSLAYDVSIRKPEVLFNTDLELEVRSRFYTAFGLGCKYKRLNIETRIQRSRLDGLNVQWKLYYTKLSFIVGYTLL